MDAKKKTAMDYLAAYVAAEVADLEYSQAIRIQFGGNATRWDHADATYNADTRRAYWAKVNADHEKSRLLYIMREAGASLADADPVEVL